ncbi:hypothetical protein FRACYDRAFT_272041 [Fragilariopsis cylindrus CCMP1102]|uniref:Uncharacterized protein n=1 Tax=Fragilariopsis cylindrus CCMP1102 TaxID=635003 RepID=A0A1E7EMS5_9STRA|nr:hypothetical protein FRACYDRAFT_272041 [Fragilariopsis cylindrus CCMP1102]|eukprot:OEU07211.1 hypothetical protein FRACYDRAFT_272041 [Fragilariopsis cylindrus CCMP1102]
MKEELKKESEAVTAAAKAAIHSCSAGPFTCTYNNDTTGDTDHSNNEADNIEIDIDGSVTGVMPSSRILSNQASF